MLQHPMGQSNQKTNTEIWHVYYNELPVERQTMNREEIVKIYEENLENEPSASDDVRKAYTNLNNSLQDYINALCEDAFVFGYKTAMQQGGR